MRMASVLIVDDDANFRNTLSRILAKKGYETYVADSGFRALEMVKGFAFDVVLMDIKMPVMNGVETYKKLKAIMPHGKVILMTAFSVDDIIKDALKEGVYAVVRKPFDADTIVNMIEKSKNGALVAIVDDDPNVCKTMKSVLERKGYGINTCSSGEECIALAKEKRHDVFCIDIRLPALNGIETYLEVKKINPKAVVVMMTAYRQGSEDLIKQVIKNGAYTCLYKPLDMDAVIEIVDKVSEGLNKPKD